MNAVLRDKCVARRIDRAGCVEALGIQRVRHSAEDTRVPTAAERVMAWRLRSGRVGLGNAYTFNRKKRDWRATVPKPLCQPASRQRNTPPPVAVARAGSHPHSGPCSCGDDAQRHYALIARDLMAQGRDAELTDDMRQAYDYEFGGVPEPEMFLIPEF